MHKTLRPAITYIMVANAANDGYCSAAQKTDHVHVLRIAAAAGEITDMHHEIKFVSTLILQYLLK